MPYRLIWSPEAVADMTELRAYIARDSEMYAAAQIERILSAVDQLAAFPRMGRRVPEIDEDGIRELIVDRYRVIYRVRNEAVELAAVVHGARDLRAALQDRSL